VLDTPQEIHKWIQSRKDKFPTKRNIERKQKSMQAKMDKGIPVNQQMVDGGGSLSLLEKKLAKKVVMISDFETKRERKKRKRKHTPANMDNEAETHKIVKVQEEPLEEGETVVERPVLSIQPTQIEPQKTIDVDGKVEVISKSNEDIKQNNPHQKKHNNHRPKPGNQKHNEKLAFRYKRNTIYEELHKKDKDSELSVLLQCFRYIVKQNLCNPSTTT